jgi:hypothetical protein
MNITPKAIAFAIHRIFASHQVGVGCSLPLKQFMAAWPETLLRKADLGKGLEALRKTGHIEMNQTAEGPAVRLLNEDFGLVRTLQDREAIATLNRLRDARRRPQGHLASLVSGVKFGRRPGEPATPG